MTRLLTLLLWLVPSVALAHSGGVQFGLQFGYGGWSFDRSRLVSQVGDGLADDGTEGTLRWAVEQANTRAGEDTIVFEAKTFATPQTIFLASHEMPVTDPAQTTIIGPAVGVPLNSVDVALPYWVGAATMACSIGLTLLLSRPTDVAEPVASQS